MKKARRTVAIGTFSEKVRRVVATIPRGQVMTYGQVARKAGNPGAARAVGTIMRKNFDTKVPCHRVISSTGKIGAYNRGGPSKKQALLITEGVQVSAGRVILK